MRKLIVILVVGFLLAGIVSAAPVAHWTFDIDGSDSSGNGHHTVLYGGATIDGSGGILGGGALQLDGVDSFASTYDTDFSASSYNGITGSNARSISTWVQAVGGASAAAQNDIFAGWGGVDATGQNRYDFGLGNSTDSDLRSELNAGAAQTAIGSTNLRDGNWHHVALSYSLDSQSVDLYVNGKLYESASYGTVTPNTTDEGLGVYIGTGVREGSGSNGLEIQSTGFNGFADRFFEGNIDDVGIWDSNIGATDVALLHALGRIGPNDLSNLASAADLWAGSPGDTAVINGVTWEKVSGLTGELGDWDQAGGDNALDSFVVLDGSGGGLQVIPEPASIGLIGLFGLLLWIHRKFKGK